MTDQVPEKFEDLDQDRRAKANDIQIGGTHYKGQPIQPWDYIAANNIPFLEGNAIKYLSRWRDKNGLEDVKKALHYVQKLIEVEEAKGTA